MQRVDRAGKHRFKFESRRQQQAASAPRNPRKFVFCRESGDVPPPSSPLFLIAYTPLSPFFFLPASLLFASLPCFSLSSFPFRPFLQHPLAGVFTAAFMKLYFFAGFSFRRTFAGMQLLKANADATRVLEKLKVCTCFSIVADSLSNRWAVTFFEIFNEQLSMKDRR